MDDLKERINEIKGEIDCLGDESESVCRIFFAIICTTTFYKYVK